MIKYSKAGSRYLAPQTDISSEVLLFEQLLADSGNTEPIDGGGESDITW